MLTHVEFPCYTPFSPFPPPLLLLALRVCLCVCYMHFAQILSFPFRLDSNKNNVNKSYNNYNNSNNNNRNRFVGNALFVVVVAGAKLDRRCSEAACAAAVFILQMPIGSGSSSPNQSDAPSMSVRQFVCPAEKKCRLAGQQQQLALHEGKGGGCCKLEELGIGTGLLLPLLGGRNWLPAVLNYKRSLFFWFCLQHIQFFVLFTVWIAILLLFCSLISVDKFCGNQGHKRKNNLTKLTLN